MVRPAMVMLVFLNVIGALQLFTEPLLLGAFQPQAISDAFTPTLYITMRGSGEASTIWRRRPLSSLL